MSQDNESRQVQVPWQLKMMVTDSASDIMFLATYNLFQASEDAVKANHLQDSYHKKLLPSNQVTNKFHRRLQMVISCCFLQLVGTKCIYMPVIVIFFFTSIVNS